MFKLDLHLFKICYDYCKIIGEGFGFTVVEGFLINGFVIVGTVLIAISKVENRKC